jgi:polyisoprenoid-binding protein YceI
MRKRSNSPRRVLLFALLAWATAAAPGAAAVARLRIDPARSKVGFTITRPGETIDGTAPQLSGEVRLDPEHPFAGSSVTLKVDPAAMATGNGIRDRKMRNSHLEVAKYPAIEFQSTSVQPAEGAEAGPLAPGATRKAVVEGRLTLHGVTRTLRIPVVIGYDRGLLTADGTIAFTLSEFQIPIPKVLWIVLDDKVTVTFHAAAGPAS